MTHDLRDDLKHPMQPLGFDGAGVVRFKQNRIVRWLLDEATAGRAVDLNRIARESSSQGFTAADHRQFAQLIGYSLSGYGELSYVTDASFAKAARRAELAQRDDVALARDEAGR